MYRQSIPTLAPVEPETYPLGENTELSASHFALALVTLSHTPVEHRLYSAMLNVSDHEPSQALVTVRTLASITGIQSLSTIRRALDGLLVKLSIERAERENGNGKREHRNVYRAYRPGQVLERRKRNGSPTNETYRVPDKSRGQKHSFDRAIARVAENPMLSRREAQVALCCVEGLTNAEIGKRLAVSEQTVKFHLRHVFIKFGVKRRAELISRLLM
ncbi:MAG TPA: LuxR C-terminal-related transcriptional regulator [Pyrinomonadaceae bacterium]